MSEISTSCSEFEIYTPWNDGSLPSEIYESRIYQSFPILLGYTIIYTTLIVFMFNRYVYSNIFWSVFTIVVIWGILAMLSIWYITLYQGILAGILLAIIFILLQIVFMNISIEQEHQQRIQLITVKYSE